MPAAVDVARQRVAGRFVQRERESERENEKERDRWSERKESRGIKIDPSVAGTTCNLVMKSIPRSNARARARQ